MRKLLVAATAFAVLTSGFSPAVVSYDKMVPQTYPRFLCDLLPWICR